MAARPNKKGRDPHAGEHGTYLHRALVESDAFRALTPIARLVFIQLMLEWKGSKFSNNGKLRLSTRQAAVKVGCDKGTVSAAFHDLQKKGFIIVTSLGALGVRGVARGPTYEITQWPLPGEKMAKKLYKQWTPSQEFEVKRHSVNNPSGKRGNKTLYG